MAVTYKVEMMVKVQSVSREDALAIAKKYYQWSFPLIEQEAKSEFKRVINWEPRFDGRKASDQLAVKLSYDVSFLSGWKGTVNVATALACAAFEISSMEVWSSNNLGCAVSNFCDSTGDDKIRAMKKDIYADAEAAFFYSLGLSLQAGLYTVASLVPLVSLGSLYLDMGKNEDAREMFEAALKVRRGYPPALAGMRSYYAAAGKPQMSSNVRKQAESDPTILGEAFNDIVKKTDDVPSRGKDLGSEAECENYLEELTKIDPITYADVFGKIDPKTAKETKEGAKKLIEKMKFTMPNLSILTQYTTVNKNNYLGVKAAVKAVDISTKAIEPYVKKYHSGSVNASADLLERLGVTSRIGGKTAPNYLRDVAKNPDGKHDTGKEEGKRVQNDIVRSVMALAKEMSESVTKIAGNDNPDQEDVDKFYRNVRKMDPLAAVHGINPFDYANSWDILIQQFNAKILIEKMAALASYMNHEMAKATSEFKELSDHFVSDLDKVTEKEGALYRMLHMIYIDSRPNDPKVEQLSIQEHFQIHKEFPQQYNVVYQRHFSVLTQYAAVRYKKLEKSIPRRYKDIMKHLVCISDPRVRQEQENRLIGLISNHVLNAMAMVMVAYDATGEFRETMCDCDEEAMKRRIAEINAEKKIKDNEALARQKKAKDAFINREVDENSSFYKDYIKKHEREWDLIFFKYRSNDFFNATDAWAWTPAGSFNHSSVKNNFTGQTKGRNRLSLNVSLGIATLSGKWEVDYVRGADGKIHPQNLDRRTSIEASVGKGPLSAAVGVSSSSRGTQVYAGSEFTGNGYLDSFIDAATWGSGKGSHIEGMTSKKVWSGSYTFE